MAVDETTENQPTKSDRARVEDFLVAVEAKTVNVIHRRLLRACRATDPGSSMETELGKIVDEILHEA
jgi:hypothetical protein